ncbi:TSC22 domain family protein 4-like, partial [Falco rusticolus]|uniref:TSC22 domain family protein 4-like n=1 Tax=Falco rusticolus TaxID=120794 RepID=UPI0018868772
MSRKRSGFVITSVRGGGSGNGAGGGGATSASGSSPGGSRFRLVRLPGPGEPLRRGRWLCREFYERDPPPRGGGRVALSLDSPRAPPPSPPPPLPPPGAPHQPRSLGDFAQLVEQALPPSPRPRGGTAALSARLGLAGEESEEEGTASGVSAIDNKIEQAMELVKSHVLLAVREEVEQLRERIQELRRRHLVLERENCILRRLATPQQLARLRLSPQPPSPPPPLPPHPSPPPPLPPHPSPP